MHNLFAFAGHKCRSSTIKIALNTYWKQNFKTLYLSGTLSYHARYTMGPLEGKDSTEAQLSRSNFRFDILTDTTIYWGLIAEKYCLPQTSIEGS